MCVTISIYRWLPKRFETFGNFPFAAVTGIPVKYFKLIRKIKAEREYGWIGIGVYIAIDRYKGIILNCLEKKQEFKQLLHVRLTLKLPRVNVLSSSSLCYPLRCTCQAKPLILVEASPADLFLWWLHDLSLD